MASQLHDQYDLEAALLEPGAPRGSSTLLAAADACDSSWHASHHELPNIPAKDLERAEEERIRMRDCRNMISLCDAVQRGRLQASLAALRAGYFGGDGFLAQVGFMGAGAIVLFGSLGWLLLVEIGYVGGDVIVLFQAGWWCCVPVSISFFLRGWYLRKLEFHERSESVDAMNEEERVGRGAQLSLTMALLWVGVFIFWAESYYVSVDGAIDLSPVLPEQNHTFVVLTGIALVPVVLILLPMSWLVHQGKLKRAQNLLYLLYLVLGAVFAGAGVMVPGPLVSLPRAVLVLCALGAWVVGTATWAILWHRKQQAMTKDLQSDMDSYDAVWVLLNSDPQQRAALEGLERLVAAHSAQEQFLWGEHGKQAAATTAKPGRKLHLKARKTRDQLLVMLTQAWGVNDKFQRIAASWKGARRRKRACCRSGALGPLRRSGAPTMVTPHGFGTLCGAAWSSTSQPTFRDASA